MKSLLVTKHIIPRQIYYVKLKCIAQITSAFIEPEENLDSQVSLKRSNIKTKEELYLYKPSNIP